MSNPQHFKMMITNVRPSVSMLSDQLELGWDVVSIIPGGATFGGYTIYFKQLAQKEGE